MSGLTVEDYTEKCIVIRGNTQPHTQKLLGLGGKYNDRLKRGGPGWIFPMSKKDIVQKFMDNPGNPGNSGMPQRQEVPTTKEYEKLLARIDTLEKGYKSLQLQIKSMGNVVEEDVLVTNEEGDNNSRRLLPISKDE